MADETSTVPQGIANQANIAPSAPVKSTFAQEQQDQLMDFAKARVFVERIVNDWKSEVAETDERRKTRDVNVDVQALRNDGSLDEDETLIPDRVIETNIQREHPAFVNYLKNSRRLAIFTCLSDPDRNVQKLELDFTRGMTYTGWELPFFKENDGAAAHGWDFVEVVFDETKPFNVGIEHCGHDKVFFPRTTLDIQDSPELIRAYDVTISQLKKFVEKNGFSADQINLIIEAISTTTKQNETVRIYKRYKKVDGVVWVSWFGLDHGVSDWLKAPQQFFIGIKNQVPSVDQMTGTPTSVWKDSMVDIYPLFCLPYMISEKPKVVDNKGRVFLDENKQEAQTAILSAFVTQLTRASAVFGSPAQEDGTGSSLKELEDVKLTPGKIFNKPINFWSMPNPDPLTLKAMEYFDRSNSEDTNQVNFSALNRVDSRKTAKEMDIAQQEQQKMNSVQLTLKSTHIRQVYSFVWLIVQSQALQGNIALLLTKKQVPQINPATQQPMIDPMTNQPIMTTKVENDTDTIKQVYDLRAAGDTDVIQKAEKVQQMKQDWPVVSQTVLASAFLAELIRLEYPDTGEKWAAILEQQDPFNQSKVMLQQMANVMQGMLKDHPEMMKSLKPQEQQVVNQMIQQSLALAAPPQGTQPPK